MIRDDRVLARQHRRSMFRERLVSLALVAPLFLFLILTLGVPLGGMLWRAVSDQDVYRAFPQTIAALKHWKGDSVPDESVFRLLASDLEKARSNDTLPLAARRLNYAIAGFRSVLFTSARQISGIGTQASFKLALIKIDPAWGDLNYWGAIRNASGPTSLYFLLSAIDLTEKPNGSITQKPTDDRLFIALFERTLGMATVVTVICILLGFPLSYFLSTLPKRLAFPMLVLVLVPFWTSLLVRTAAWVVLLQNNGIINDILRDLQITQKPLALIYNRVGVYIAMTHILLPFLVLPLYSVMRGISPVHMKAAISLGAAPMRAFFKVYLPQCKPGIGAGCLLVFTLAIGFYVTPALVGGADDQMISYYIAYFTNTSANWGLACALSVWLLLATLALYGVYSRFLTVVPGQT